MQSKLGQLKDKWAAGDKWGAVAVAAKFHDRSEATQAAKAAWDAKQNEAFYRQLGKCPDTLLAKACAALAERFNLTAPQGL